MRASADCKPQPLQAASALHTRVGLDLTGRAAREQLATFVAWLEEYDLEASREERTFSVWLSSLLDAPLRWVARHGWLEC